MPTRLTINHTPIITIRKRAHAYPQRLAQALVTHLNTNFSGQSPAPIGAPPARKSGALARSITAVRVDSTHWRVVVRARYGAYLEYGTRRMKARPFFMRGFDAVRQRVTF